MKQFSVDIMFSRYIAMKIAHQCLRCKCDGAVRLEVGVEIGVRTIIMVDICLLH